MKEHKDINIFRNIWYRPDALFTPFALVDRSRAISFHVTLDEAIDARDRWERGEQA